MKEAKPSQSRLRRAGSPLKGELMPAGRDRIRLACGDPPSPKGKVYFAAQASALKRKADMAENGGECHKTSACIPICAVI